MTLDIFHPRNLSGPARKPSLHPCTEGWNRQDQLFPPCQWLPLPSREHPRHPSLQADSLRHRYPKSQRPCQHFPWRNHTFLRRNPSGPGRNSPLRPCTRRNPQERRLLLRHRGLPLLFQWHPWPHSSLRLLPQQTQGSHQKVWFPPFQRRILPRHTFHRQTRSGPCSDMQAHRCIPLSWGPLPAPVRNPYVREHF